VIKVLKEIGEINFPPKVDQIIVQEWIDGRALLGMSLDMLKELKIPTGPALNIFNFVAALK